MKVLIIGATGMLAKPVIEHFDKLGLELRLFSRSIEPAAFSAKHETIQGDVFNPSDLAKAIEGCDAIHINLSKLDEAKATEEIVKVAKQKNTKLISFVSGSTVAEENRWFWMIDNKFRAEQTIINSGIAYLIFRPSWFFESLPLMVRNGKAMMIGKQPHLINWIAAEDYAKMVVTAYQKEESWNAIYYIHGPEKYLFEEALLQYAKKVNPKTKKVAATPIGMMKFIAFLTGKKELKIVASMFAYFEKVPQMGDPTKANELLGAPTINLEKWLANS
jgi:uncharacterized protein YbjT (DUF2867 family)